MNIESGKPTFVYCCLLEGEAKFCRKFLHDLSTCALDASIKDSWFVYSAENDVVIILNVKVARLAKRVGHN